MNILLIYGTTEGQTRKVAEFIKSEAEKAGHSVVMADATENPSGPDGFDAVLIGSSIHLEKYHNSVKYYIRKNADPLNKMHSAFFSVSLTAASDEEESWSELKRITSEFYKETGWSPAITEYFAGALRFTEYDFMKKFIMRQIARKSGRSYNPKGDTEYTNWEEVSAFVQRFYALWLSRPQTVSKPENDQDAVA